MNRSAKLFVPIVSLFLLLFCVEAALAVSKPGWSWKNPKPQGNDIASIKYLSPTTALSVGSFGTIMRSRDAGANWEKMISGTSNNLNAITNQSNVCVAVGAGGTVMQSPNGGSSWKAASVPVSVNLNDIAFQGSSTGWIVGDGGVLLKSTDAGVTWHKNPTVTLATLNSVHFVDSINGFAAGNQGTVIRTTNGGTTWKELNPPTNNDLFSIFFINANTGFVTGAGATLYKTVNGGSSWSSCWSPALYDIIQVYFPTSQIGFATCQNGLLLKTSNAGASWSIVNQYGSGLNCINFANSSLGLIGGTGGILLKTSNAQDWAQSQSATFQEITEVDFIESQTWVAAGALGTIVKSTDGGESWTLLNSGTISKLFGLEFWNSSNGVAFGDSGLILKTSNGGSSWNAASVASSSTVFDIDFIDSNNAFAVGFKGALLKTTNGGSTWTAETSLGAKDLNAIHFASQTAGFIVSAGGKIYKTSNSGVSWSQFSSPVATALNDIDSLGSRFIIVGNGGTILLSVDGGETWSEPVSGTTNNLNRVEFEDVSAAFAVGKGGMILKSEDGGQSWFELPSPAQCELQGVDFCSSSTGIVSGPNGCILKTNNGGEEIPDTTPPSKITDLRCSSATTSSITLDWMAPGDDTLLGDAGSYDIRYSTVALSTLNWAGANQITSAAVPGAVGLNQRLTVPGLNMETTYYFGIKSFDAQLNASQISNILMQKTPGPDTTAPVKPSSLKIILTQNPPGFNDVLIGGTGAVEGLSLVKIYSTSPQPANLITFCYAKSDGSFGPLSIGDNRYSSICITATDSSNNVSSPLYLNNDVIRPLAAVSTKLALRQNPPGKADTILGLAGSCSAGCYAKAFSNSTLTSVIGSALVKTDGSFGPISLGNNRHGIVYLAVVDKAGNKSSALSRKNDIVKPRFPKGSVYGYPSSVKRGSSTKIFFKVTDVAPKTTLTMKVYLGTVLKGTFNFGLKKSNLKIYCLWKAPLIYRRGKYTIRLYSRDLAGNQALPGLNYLTLK